jgi:hypothetical protein
MMLVLHDDATRIRLRPSIGLPDTKVVTFTQALYDEAKIDGWTVISMKNNWKRIFAFEHGLLRWMILDGDCPGWPRAPSLSWPADAPEAARLGR